jgi:hypothetical protein
MNNIYRVYTNKTIGYFTSKNDAISLIYYIPDAKIEVFNNITPIGIYQLKNKVLYFNNNEEKLEGYMEEWFQNKFVTEKSELQVFIPLSENTNENKKLNMDELALKIKRLQEEAEQNDQKLEKIKELADIKEEAFLEIKGEFDEEKKNFEKEKESWNQLKSKLEVDKRVYFIIKEQLESGELTSDSIPVLFQEKYPIFKHMFENNLINENDTISTEEINNYLEILPEFKLNNNIDHTFGDLFSSSDPIYLNKKNKNALSTETSENK